MNPSCSIPWTWLDVDIDRKKIRGCCKTNWIEDDGQMFKNKVLIQRRKNFLNNIKDPDCNHCWNLEKEGKISYRQYTKLNSYLQTDNFSLDIEVPKTLTISLGNLCNIACSYCNEYYSTVWSAEKKIPIKLNLDNHFENNFLSWLETIIENENLSHIIILGGEPTINPSFHKILEVVKNLTKHRKSLLKITVQTNGLFSQNVLDKIINTRISSVHFSYRFSIDALYERAEFIRTGLKWKDFEFNFLELLKVKNEKFSIGVHPTLSVYNLGGLNDFLRWLDNLDNDWEDLGINHVQSPYFISLNSLGGASKKILNIKGTFKKQLIRTYALRTTMFVNSFTGIPDFKIIKKGIELQEHRSGISSSIAVPELVELLNENNL